MSRRARDRRGSVKVVSGELGGRRIETPPGDATRPTAGRVREALFNALDSMGAVEGARALDAYAGSGALGIEALSRGAAHVTFAEVDGAAREVISDNLRALGLTGRASVVSGDGANAVARAPEGGWDVVFLDPPYSFDDWEGVLAAVRDSLADEGVVVVESVADVELPEGMHATRTKWYGGTVVLFAIRGAPE